MELKYLEEFRNVAHAIDTYLTSTHREITHPGGGAELDNILRQLLPQEYGRYVDIGASDPVQLSNTWAFYSRGWTGLLVEPDPLCWQRLLQLRPNDYLWPTALSDRYGKALLRADLCGVSSIEADWPCPPNAREVVVDLVPTREVLQSYSAVRNDCLLCSIDVEGHEQAVLQGIDFETFQPKVFVVESLKYDPVESHEQLWPQWEPILLANGYEFLTETRDKVNRIYRRSK